MKCLHPVELKNGAVVPCGKCVNCLAKKRASWVFRLKQEAKQYPFSLFLTLTYNDDFLPTYKLDTDFHGVREIAVVSKRDVQLFMKRLRKKYSDKYKFRYFVTSEYGSNFGRPHYHMILFGFPFFGKEAGDILASIWSCGFVQAETLSDKAISYVCKYMYERSAIPDVISKLELKEFYPFMLSSRNPGIGLNFVEEKSDFYRSNPRDYVRDESYLQKMPRYYRDKLYDSEMKEQLNDKRKEYEEKQGYEAFKRMQKMTFDEWKAERRKLREQYEAYEQRIIKKLNKRNG